MTIPPTPTQKLISDLTIDAIYAIADLHVDYTENLNWIKSLDSQEWLSSALIVAGDVTDNINLLMQSLSMLNERFAVVCYVPGNHELWLRNCHYRDSIEKFHIIMDRCHEAGIYTSPIKIATPQPVWVVPLLAWYIEPDARNDGLYIPKAGEDSDLLAWADHYLTCWPQEIGEGEKTISAAVCDYFLNLNKENVSRLYDAPVISFSHFLPRKELMFSTPPQNLTRPIETARNDAYPTFNFSRVAGCEGLEQQIRQLGSTIHFYGHQHRDRQRLIENVCYQSHCLGYPHETKRQQTPDISPLKIWPVAPLANAN